ncbi:DUF86 domain-containing protein [Bacillus sp. 31A1R]|uniref:DUF86 domain-containing protein n=1 Tax=Robertmurraya mangrovi TaxID=3098077 RepID=A0ABU5IY81_9BACI|nr:DUF86 domain-containing protein [Bacillus sp. 31A1R]MDZ5472125.1 DUF86 domain-containing protein [Bacillus sp. 31A1R]
MYFVDRDKIELILKFLENQIALFEKTEKWESAIEKAALERITHTIIESILDVGNAMIDGFIMRDPGSYEDIVDILDDEKVVTPEMSSSFKVIVNERKKLVQDYTNIDHKDVENTFNQHLENLKLFAPKVREYLIHELGPVTAFKN